MAKDKEVVSGEIVPAPAASPATVDARLTVEELKGMLLKAQDEVSVSPEDVEREIFERMLNAESVEELFGSTSVLKWGDNLNVPVLVESVKFNGSDFKDGLGLYAVVTGKMAGKTVNLSLGARTPLVQLLIARERGWLPYRVMLEKAARPTEAGYFPLNLIPATAEDEPF